MEAGILCRRTAGRMDQGRGGCTGQHFMAATLRFIGWMMIPGVLVESVCITSSQLLLLGNEPRDIIRMRFLYSVARQCG